MTRAPQRALRPDRRLQRLDVADPVLQRDRDAIRREQRGDRAREGLGVVRLHGQQDGVERSAQRRRVGGDGESGNPMRPPDAIDGQAAIGDDREMVGAAQ
jgi:hypothetical protein